jgi:hypothetical protein
MTSNKVLLDKICLIATSALLGAGVIINHKLRASNNCDENPHSNTCNGIFIYNAISIAFWVAIGIVPAIAIIIAVALIIWGIIYNIWYAVYRGILCCLDICMPTHHSFTDDNMDIVFH